MTNDLKRLAIYAFFDKDGIADEYNFYLLNNLKEHIDELMVVIIGKITKESRERFEQIANNVIAKENKGFDIWAHKDALDFYGEEYLENFDEIIMLNSTFFGPLYPFSEMFDTMQAKNIDFWGITMHHEHERDDMGTSKYGFLPNHIQSYFIAVRKKMFTSHEFKKYWRELKLINSYYQAVGFHEVVFTKYFEDMGYTWEVYVNTKKIPNYALNPIFEDPYKLIKEFRCPILKRKNFLTDYVHLINTSVAQYNLEAYNYIKENTNYDVNLIWDNILRVENQYDFYLNMGLNYILDSEEPKNIYKNKKVLFIIYINDKNHLDICFNYSKNIPSYYDILVVISKNVDKNEIEKLFTEIKCNKFDIIINPDDRNEISSVYTTAKDIILDYELVCYLNGNQEFTDKIDIIQKSKTYRLFENLIGSENFILNIIDLFEREDRMGFLSIPPSTSSIYYTDLALQKWINNLESTKEFLKEYLNIKANISRDKLPLKSDGHSFWFRPKALSDLFNLNLKYIDYKKTVIKNKQDISDIISFVEPLVVQKNGYYPAYLLSQDFAKREIVTNQYMLTNINTVMFYKFGACKYQDALYQLTLLQPATMKIRTKIKRVVLRLIPNPIKSLIKKILKRK